MYPAPIEKAPSLVSSCVRTHFLVLLVLLSSSSSLSVPSSLHANQVRQSLVPGACGPQNSPPQTCVLVASRTVGLCTPALPRGWLSIRTRHTPPPLRSVAAAAAVLSKACNSQLQRGVVHIRPATIKNAAIRVRRLVGGALINALPVYLSLSYERLRLPATLLVEQTCLALHAPVAVHTNWSTLGGSEANLARFGGQRCGTTSSALAI